MDDFCISCGSIELRRLTHRHAHQVLRMAGDPELSRYLPWRPHASLAESREFIDRSAELWARGESYFLGIFDRARSDLLGATGIVRLERENWLGEVGTWIGVAHQGHGRNREVKAASFALGFDLLGLRRLEFFVRADNERSVRAMNGLPDVRHEATLRDRLATHAGELVDAEVYALLADEWQRDAYPPVDVVGAHGRFVLA